MSATIIEALRSALAAEMERDLEVFVMGEDIRIGGSFHLTLGLAERFGEDRILDTPVSESGFVGLAVGAAVAGARPVVDFQYGEFLLCAADQVIQQACKLPAMSGGQVRVPLVLHAPTGASGRGAQHANSIENVFAGVPGLKVAAPATAYDAKGAMTAAIRSDDPVLVISHKKLYGTKGRALEGGRGVVGDVPTAAYELEVGAAEIRRPGRDVTIASALLMVHRSLEAADALAAEGIEAEVVDMRWLAPLDVQAVAESVERTGRLLVVEEGPRASGWGAQVAAGIADVALGSLDAPIKRLAGLDAPLPFAPHLEHELVPSAERIAETVRGMMNGA